MKRQAKDADLSDPPSPRAKRARRVHYVLPTPEPHYSDTFRLGNEEQILITRLQVKLDPEHACVKQINAVFCLAAKGQTKGHEIGHLYGQTIDRAETDPHQPNQTLFVSEMLSKDLTSEATGRPMQHSTGKEKKKIDETEVVMQHIFHRDGTSRDEYSSKSLEPEARLHFITDFQLKSAYRGTGLAKKAMQTYLREIQKLPGDYRFRGTVLLSPAALPQENIHCAATSTSKPIKTLVEIERALVVSYEKAGFKLWSKGDDSLAGLAITIMGIRISGRKFRDVRTEPAAAQEALATVDDDQVIRRIDSGLQRGW